MAVNTNKIGYSVQDVCQILHCSTATVHKLINNKEIECLITDAKTPGGRRQFRFLKEHIQHYMLKHYDKFEDMTLRTWGVMTTPKKYTANAATPRIPIDAFSKPLEGTPTTPKGSDVGERVIPSEWSKPKKPYIRTPEIKEKERQEAEKSQKSTPPCDNQNYHRTNLKFQKQFPTFRLEVDTSVNGMVATNDIVINGIESFTAGDIAKALLTDRNYRVKELRICFNGMTTKED